MDLLASEDEASSGQHRTAPDAPALSRGDTAKTRKAQNDPKLPKDGANSTFSVNESYAKSYDARKRRETLQKEGKQLVDEDDESSSEEEDSDGELLTPSVQHKIFDTLRRIKMKDPSVYDKTKAFFGDDDFQDVLPVRHKGRQKPLTYQDLVRNTLLAEGADAFENEEAANEKSSETVASKTYVEEQLDLKKDFLKASGDSTADDLLDLKEQTTEERQEDETHYLQFLKTQKASEADDIMRRYWGADDELDEEQQFLRDYILREAWREDRQITTHTDDSHELDDEEHVENAEEFEAKYNFRFEEENGRHIQGHMRKTEGSARKENDRRKRQREAKKLRQQEEKNRKNEDLKRLKNLKRQELVEKMTRIRIISGKDDVSECAIDFDADFDPDAHDKEMEQLLGANYEDSEENLKGSDLTGKQPDCLKDIIGDTPWLSHPPDPGTVHCGDLNLSGEKLSNSAEDGLWWLCDSCKQGIQPGNRRFDCTVCENYTLCKKCFRNVRHPHQLIRKKVPRECQPPSEAVNGWGGGASHDDEVEDLMELHYEDIIGGDQPTRFKYCKVTPETGGLTTKQILTLSDAELNKRISLKKLAPYRESFLPPQHRTGRRSGKRAKLANTLNG